jgi:hypothetical protein
MKRKAAAAPEAPQRGTAEFAEKLNNERRAEAKRQGRLLINIQIEAGTGGTGFITCKEMKCSFPTRNVIASVSALVAESIEKLIENSDPFPPLRPARWLGNTICEATAMDPRNDGRASS